LQGNVYHLQMKLKPSLNNFRKHPKLALLFLFALAVNVASLIVSPPFKNPSFKLYVEQGAVVLAVIVVGVLAFEFRERARYEYGFTELVVASFTALQIAIRTPFGHELLGQWTALAGCVYVIVRGMANMSDANKEKNTDEATAIPPEPTGSGGIALDHVRPLSKNSGLQFFESRCGFR
jgi:hypothetical protein